MIEKFKILYEGGCGEITEKKSRFIANTRPAESEEEALAFIGEMRKRYWDASHNCFAYVIGEENGLSRASDDGEPSQTAGRPMLDVLLGEKIHNVCVVVTRYFGGTLLGTGGLARAYSGAAREGLKASKILEKRLAEKVLVSVDYGGVGKIQYIAAQMGITVLDAKYTENVEMELLAPVKKLAGLESQITEVTSGKSRIERLGPVYYGVLDKEVILFPPQI